MKLKQDQIGKLAHLIYEALSQDGQIKILSSQDSVLNKIEGILLADAQKEEEIEREARKMMDQFKAKIEAGDIDYHKMYSMVKKQLMKDKKFIA